VRVNLLFDHDGPDVTVRSPYSAPCLTVTPKSVAPLWVRLPRWAQVQASTLPGARREGDWLLFPAPEPGISLEICFALAESKLVLEHDAHDIRVRLRGDSVAAMDNFGAPLTFFEAYSHASSK
jgi:hypothetical protein